MTKQIPAGYKQTKMGVIPEDWEVIRLDEAVDFLDYKRKPLRDEERKQIQGGYPYYGASGIIDYVNDYIFDEDLVLLGEDGANIIDRSSRLVFIARGKYWVNNHAHVLKPKQNFSHYFLCEYLESLRYEQYNTGTAQPKLNKEVISGVLVIKPLLIEQEKIAEILSTWDDAITKQEQLIEQKQVFKKGIMQQIFSQKLCFKDDNGNDYPAWQTQKFNDCLFSVSLKNNQILSSEISQMGKYPVIDQGQQFIVGYSDIERAYKDYPVIIYGDHTTIVKYVYFDFIVGGDGTKTLKTLEKHNLKFMYYVLQVSNVPQDGYKRHFSALKAISFVIPQCLREQTKIVTFLTSIDDEIDKQTEILNQLKLQKQSLMQKLLTGQVRVKI